MNSQMTVALSPKMVCSPQPPHTSLQQQNILAQLIHHYSSIIY